MSLTVLGFDVGQDKIGVAVGSTLTGRGQPLTVVLARPEAARWAVIARLVREWQPARVVVGLPLTLTGARQPATEEAERFRQEFERRFAIPTVASDERMSTQEARRRFAALRRAGLAKAAQQREIDALAAAVILEDHLATAQC